MSHKTPSVTRAFWFNEGPIYRREWEY